MIVSILVSSDGACAAQTLQRPRSSPGGSRSEVASVRLSFVRFTDDVETRVGPCPGAGYVAPLAKGALVAEEDESAVDGCALGSVPVKA